VSAKENVGISEIFEEIAKKINEKESDPIREGF